MSERILFPSTGKTPPNAPSVVLQHIQHPGWPGWTKWAAICCGALALTLVLLLAGIAWSLRFPGDYSKSSDGVKLGRAFAPRLAAALADGFDAEAAALEQGKTVAEADAVLKQTFHDAREKAFAEFASAAFAAIVPAGSEPKDPGVREAFEKLHRDFAKGLREAK